MSYVFQEYPAWRVSPTGEGRLIERAEDLPEGWMTPEAYEKLKEILVDAPAAKAAKPKRGRKVDEPTIETVFDRNVAIAALRERGYDVSDDLTDDEIQEFAASLP